MGDTYFNMLFLEQLKNMSIYSKLYNSCIDSRAISSMYDQLEDSISFHSLNEVEKITSELVKEAMNHLNCSKSDNIFELIA